MDGKDDIGMGSRPEAATTIFGNVRGETDSLMAETYTLSSLETGTATSTKTLSNQTHHDTQTTTATTSATSTESSNDNTGVYP